MKPYKNRLLPFLLNWVTLACFIVTPGYPKASPNLALDDPAYALLDKLVTSNLTFTNALTIRPITRMHAAQLIAEAIERRRHELDTTQRQEPFLDEVLEHLAGHFKRELQQIGFFYTPRPFSAFLFTPLADTKLDTIFVYDQFIRRDSSRLTANLQGVFRLNEGFIPGNEFSLRLRTASYATLWSHFAAYLEPELIVRSNPLLAENIFDSNLHKGYLKVGYRNIELEIGRDTAWWGPGFQGDLILSPNAPPFDLLKLYTPLPFRLPWLFHDLGIWQIAYFVTRLDAEQTIPYSLINGLRVTFHPVPYLQFGYTNTFQAFGRGGVSLTPWEFLEHVFVPTLTTTTKQANGLVTYDVVVTLPFIRKHTFLTGVKLYWQRGYDHTGAQGGILGGGNIIGGIVDAGRWDLRLEFAETRDPTTVWYTHPLYQSGFAFKKFFIGHPLGGAAQGFFARFTYYTSPTSWIAADGAYEQYGFNQPAPETTQQRLGLEASYQFPWQRSQLMLAGRIGYGLLEGPMASDQHTVTLHLSARWHF